ncbi:dihydrolipoyl dehydrogenase [Corticibacter populi]|uniref:Dihydrolipoyl dehydrogenase n=1 Tax=Corticibacter populi TaxID=1550736 RepID=A0A3M6QMB1_9BURK|nr:dihydrolipoyl dehydrogenase [Corticibacter populi]RMX04085.1 dihydrolipoyl dehydrogenase [Corticibacter populi]RZS33092.1 dihydrolipoamide dehydrogenase [Corticibacter populi]
MRTIETDVAIIGVGTAGMAAYQAAHRHTERILTIEHGPYGTTCARVGCMPSKLLIAAAQAARQARLAPHFGVQTGPVHVDGAAVMQRVREERDRFVQFSLDTVAAWPSGHKLSGTARFSDSGVLQVGEDTIVKARSFVIATGAASQVPEDLRTQLGDRLITSDVVFDWQALPGSVAVMGSGVIGLELAHALSALGVRVRLLGRGGKAGPATDPEVAAHCAELTRASIPSCLDSQLQSARRCAEGVELRYSSDGQTHTETFDFLLVATGRRPQLADLHLEAAGVTLDEQGLPPFDAQTRQLGSLPIFLAGDANNHHPVLHTASDDGFAAGHNAATWPQVQSFQRRAPLNIVFGEPQIAMVGQSHRALLEGGADFDTGTVHFRNQGRARIEARNQGVLRVYADTADGRLLGAEMVGPAAEHIGHLLAWALQQKQTVASMLACPFYHPTIEEGLRTALQQLRKKLPAGAASSGTGQ